MIRQLYKAVGYTYSTSCPEHGGIRFRWSHSTYHPEHIALDPGVGFLQIKRQAIYTIMLQMYLFKKKTPGRALCQWVVHCVVWLLETGYPLDRKLEFLSWHIQMGFEVHPNSQPEGNFPHELSDLIVTLKSLPLPGAGVRNGGGITYLPHLHGNFCIKNRENVILIYLVCVRVNKTIGLNVIYFRAGTQISVIQSIVIT
jgi:hypothetical protein